MRDSFIHYGRAVASWAVLTLAAQGQQLVFSTYVGGGSSDIPHAMCVDADGNIYIAGETWSADYPVTPGALQPKHAGTPSNRFGFFDANASDAFVTKMSPDGKRIIWSTFLGGSSGDTATAIAVDGQGYVYVGGRTSSPNFPTTRGSWQPSTTFNGGNGHGFVAKLNPSGTALVYATYLAGSRFDAVSGLAVDRDGGAVVVGSTNSRDFPITPGAFQDEMRQPDFTVPIMHGFIAKLNVDGSALVYSTFLSGTSGSMISAVTIDPNGYPIAVGATGSRDFAVTPGSFDDTFAGNRQAFVAKVHPMGSALIWSTFLGPERIGATAVAVLADGSICTTGDSLPAGKGPAFVLKLSGDGAFVHSTVLGGSNGASPHAIAVDGAGTAYIAGTTFSPNLPVPAGALGMSYAAAPCYRQVTNPFTNTSTAFNCGDGFVARVNAQESSLMATYFGGNDADEIFGVATSGDGVVIAGSTRSSNLPATAGAVQMQRTAGICSTTASPTALTANECEDGFVARMKFAPTATPQFAVVNGASRLSGAVTPGGLVRVLGVGISQTQVMFDEIAAPVLEAFTDLLVQVPPAIAGRKKVRVSVAGQAADVEVARASPGILIANRQNSGQAAMLNQDLTVNSQNMPAAPGTVVSMFVTGTDAAPAVYVGNKEAHVLFAGQAPSLDPGVQQINFVVPDMPAGRRPVFVLSGAHQSSQPAVSMWVGK